MRAVVFLCVCACYIVRAQDFSAMSRMPKYDSRYDYLDVDAILDSRRLVRNYVECLINSQRCTPEGKALKRILPEALRTKCARCTEKQKKTAVKVIRRLKYEYPEEWAKLSSRWDPTGDFTRYFEEVLDKEHFNTIPGSGIEIPLSALPLPAAPPSPPAPPPPPPPVLPPASPATRPPAGITPPRPIILNRFGDDGELMVGSPSSAPKPRPSTTSTTSRPFSPPITMRPRPTVMTWAGAASDTVPTRFSLRPYNTPPVYTTAITFIDQIGYKIIRTTELVTDILKNTVRAVVGR